jgi:hypothetical protein
MKAECNGKIIFFHVAKYLILNVGHTSGSAKMDAVVCVCVDLCCCMVV